MFTRATPCIRVERDDAAYPGRIGEKLGTDTPATLTLFGNVTNLQRPNLAIFSSILTPPDLILRTFDLIRTLRSASVPTIGGFQTPLEREVLGLLLRGQQSVTVCPARGIEGMRVPRPWRGPLRDGNLLIASPFTSRRRRPSVRLTALRNRLVVALAERVFVVHARPGSRTFRVATTALEWGTQVFCFDHPRNRDLVLRGASPADAATLIGSGA